MRFSKVQVYRFRNLKDAEILTNAKTIFLNGDNGQGKTNFLEALYILCYGASFRTRQDREIVTIPEHELSVRGLLSGDDRPDIEINVKYQNERKDITVNGKRIADRKDLLSNAPCILFSHEDMSFIIGGPDKKRLFLNQTMALRNPDAVDIIRQYQKVLKLRNACLKEGRSDVLGLYNIQLAQAGMVLMERREHSIRDLDAIYREVYNEIAGIDTPVSVAYHSSWRHVGSVEDAVTLLERKEEKDKEFGTTTSGPHRDSFRLIQGGGDFLSVASTGQIRLSVLVLRIAQSLLLSESTGLNPILLFDDVLLELDPEKKRKIVRFLPEYDQAFFTFLPDECGLFTALEDVMSLTVKGGTIKT